MNPGAGKPIDRREFLRALLAVGGAAAAATFLEACRRFGLTPSPVGAGLVPARTVPARTVPARTVPDRTMHTPSTSETPTAGDTRAATASAAPPQAQLQAAAPTGVVALVKTGERGTGVRQAIDLLGINPVSGKAVFLKPNYNSADPAPGSTHPDVLRTLVEELQRMGAGKITLGDRSGMGNTRRVMEKTGVFEIARELGFDVLIFDELPETDWQIVTRPGTHWQQGFPFARACLDCQAVVQACCLKTHQYGGHFTLSLKNSVGLVAKQVPGQAYNYMNELHNSAHQRRMIAEINAAYSPSLIVMDGVEAFTSGGPAKGKRVRPEVILAASDRVAIDAVGVAILRYFGTTREVSRGAIFAQEQIARAVELGLGASSPEQIQLVTGDPASAAFAQEIQQVLLQS